MGFSKGLFVCFSHVRLRMPVVPERTCRTYVAIQRQYDGRPQANRNRKSKRKTLYRKIQGEATNPTRHRCAGERRNQAASGSAAGAAAVASASGSASLVRPRSTGEELFSHGSSHGS
ncbi:membrane carboxypeptidase [Bifidobacterium adolescentis ATCC 15703]|uniref:Membrane carboxypeptidase n=1 Tax=Bifidobacterium adolescentis (strain ATCC 15703 / DSM 20083 / NCTC 11814 / E194a) TaxID=367928 RepID=A0ZZC9_BIFAA|nr:membrane carboxypeptidase [Bifidobacterium adolescentis ATCC 15703]